MLIGSKAKKSHRPPCLFLSEEGRDDPALSDGAGRRRVRFSSSSNDDEARRMSPTDAALSWITSDVGSIVLGTVGLVLLLVGRLLLDGNDGPQPYDDDGSSSISNRLVEQTRVNLLAVLAMGAVLLNGLSQLDVQSALAEQVELEGVVVPETVLLLSSLLAKRRWHKESAAKTDPLGFGFHLRGDSGGHGGLVGGDRR